MSLEDVQQGLKSLKEAMMQPKGDVQSAGRTTLQVSPELFKQVYDSPLSLPGKHRWVTKDDDVRTLEALLGIPEKAIGAPLWVRGDTRHCTKCGRETKLAGHIVIRIDQDPSEGTFGRSYSRGTKVRQCRSAICRCRFELPRVQGTNYRSAKLQVSQLGLRERRAHEDDSREWPRLRAVELYTSRPYEEVVLLSTVKKGH